MKATKPQGDRAAGGPDDQDRVVITLPETQATSLVDLVSLITEANRHDPIEFGPAVGREVW